MLYCNRKIKATMRIMRDGFCYQILLGQAGKGRKLMALLCTKGTIVQEGLNTDLTIGITRKGKPKVVWPTDDETLYMLLSSKGGYTRYGNGSIQVLRSDVKKFKVIARGKGADGEAGRIGHWDCMLIKCPKEDTIVRVQSAGNPEDKPSDLYLVHNKKVYHCVLEELEICCERLGISTPCEVLHDNRLGRTCFSSDWVML